jgi:CheY-like chemotaxis protein
MTVLKPNRQPSALVVHKEDWARQKLCESLEDSFSIRDVNSARSAISWITNHQIDVLIAGNELTDIDGWRLVRMIRSGRFCNGSLPVIIIYPDHLKISQSLAAEHNVSLLSFLETEKLCDLAKNTIAGSVKARVLVVEDDEKAADLARLALEGSYAIEVVYDGQSALDVWQARHHDLVLLDVMLPRLSGPEVLKQILAIEPTQPVVILTAYATLDRHPELMLAGASEFLSKPFDLEQLRETCAGVLRHSDQLSSYAVLRHEIDIKHEISSRVRVANKYLQSGQTALADHYLKSALEVCDDAFPTDDEWLNLVTEFGLKEQR